MKDSFHEHVVARRAGVVNPARTGTKAAAHYVVSIEPQATRDEPGLLKAFDQHRERILQAAGRVYVRHRRGSYTLAAADLG